jgi:hypothetical protein
MNFKINGISLAGFMWLRIGCMGGGGVAVLSTKVKLPASVKHREFLYRLSTFRNGVCFVEFLLHAALEPVTDVFCTAVKMASNTF